MIYGDNDNDDGNDKDDDGDDDDKCKENLSQHICSVSHYQ